MRTEACHGSSIPCLMAEADEGERQSRAIHRTSQTSRCYGPYKTCEPRLIDPGWLSKAMVLSGSSPPRALGDHIGPRHALQTVSQSVNQSVSQSIRQSLKKCQTVQIQSVDSQSVSQSVREAVSQSVSQPVSESVNQSVGQSVRKKQASDRSTVSRSISPSGQKKEAGFLTRPTGPGKAAEAANEQQVRSPYKQ
jgi:hypothetical protein